MLPDRMESIIQRQIQETAERAAVALNSYGYVADFSPDSLREIDRFFEDQTLNGEARPGGILTGRQLGPEIFALGAYVGEVIRRNLGGEWREDSGNAGDEWWWTLVLQDEIHLWPMMRAAKRLKDRTEGIAAYGAGLRTAGPDFALRFGSST